LFFIEKRENPVNMVCRIRARTSHTAHNAKDGEFTMFRKDLKGAV
jgi:hypothetical protein